jgi:hypothetical protein
VSEPIYALVDSHRRLWGGEASVFRTYFASRTRPLERDLAWLARQCHKELFDGVLPRLGAFEQQVEMLGPPRALDAPPDGLARLLTGAAEEYRHLQLFAAVHESARPADEDPLDFAALRDRGSWTENDDLGRLRARHRHEHGRLGDWASVLTEGGGATLYVEGMLLRGRGGLDDRIAEACEHVYHDEVDHFAGGLAYLQRHDLDERSWSILAEITAAQLRQRIVMRNAQFGFPLDEDAVRAAQEGHASPIDIDLERVGL